MSRHTLVMWKLKLKLREGVERQSLWATCKFTSLDLVIVFQATEQLLLEVGKLLWVIFRKLQRVKVPGTLETVNVSFCFSGVTCT